MLKTTNRFDKRHLTKIVMEELLPKIAELEQIIRAQNHQLLANDRVPQQLQQQMAQQQGQIPVQDHEAHSMAIGTNKVLDQFGQLKAFSDN